MLGKNNQKGIFIKTQNKTKILRFNNFLNLT